MSTTGPGSPTRAGCRGPAPPRRIASALRSTGSRRWPRNPDPAPRLYHRRVLTFSAQTRAASLTRMAEDRFDVLVIGGGITGAVIAAGARRPALPGARGLRPGAGVAAGAGHPVPAGAAPGTPGSHVHAGR